MSIAPSFPLLRPAVLALIAIPQLLGSQGVSLESFQQSGPRGQVTLPYSHEYSLRSRVNGRSYRIQVALPLGYRDTPSDSTRYRVMYLLDGEHELPLFAAMFRGSNTGRDGTGATVDSDPGQVIFVGVGYASFLDSLAPGGRPIPNRRRDYTPPPFPASNPEHKDWQSEQPWAGGATLFLRMLKEELIPLIDRRYRTTPDRGIHGHSLGGLFVAYALFSEPDLFARYAMTSPGLWWDGGSIFQRATEFAKGRTALRKQVFISTGGLEGAGQMADVSRMVATLCQERDVGRFAGLRIASEVVADEYHSSVVHFSRALKTLYPPYVADSAVTRDPCAGR